MDLFNLPFFRSYEAELGWLISRVANVETSEANAKVSEEAAKASEEASAASEQASRASEQLAANSAAGAAVDAESIRNSAAKIAENSARIDNLVANAGDTDNNAELLDIRVGVNSFTYEDAGDAVRSQVSNLRANVNSIKNEDLCSQINNCVFSLGGIDSNGAETTGTTSIRTGEVLLPNVSALIMSVPDNYKFRAWFYKNDGTLHPAQYYMQFRYIDQTDAFIYVMPDVSYVRVMLTHGGTTMVTDEGKLLSIVSNYKLSRDVTMHGKRIGMVENWIAGDSIQIPAEFWFAGVPAPGGNYFNSSTTRITTGFIEIPSYIEKINITGSDGYNTAYYLYDANYNQLEQHYWAGNWTVDVSSGQFKYIVIALANTDNSNISVSEYDNISIEGVAGTGTGDAGYNVPAYFNSQLADVTENVRAHQMETGINGDSFVFITDIHWSQNQKNSPALVNSIFQNTNVDKIIGGGDIITGGTKTAMIESMCDAVSAFKNIGPFYSLFGNHDTNTIDNMGNYNTGETFTKSESYAMMQKQTDFLMKFEAPCYFYFDNPTTKTRYVALDTGEEGTPLSQEQETWLRSAISDMEDGWHAIIMAHIIYQASSWAVGLQPSDLALTPFMTSVYNIIDTFNAANTSKKVEMVIGGHVHIDAKFTTPGGIPVVLTDTDGMSTFTTTDNINPNSSAGTITEQCFDIVTINYDTRTIYCDRVGRGDSRTITY